MEAVTRRLETHNTPTNRLSQRGAAMVELGFVLPLLVILVFGIIQFGIAFNLTQGLQAAAREGGRTASIPTNTNADITARVDEALVGLPFATPPTVAVSPSSCAGHTGESITVTATAPHTIAIPLLPDFNVTLTGEGVFRCE